MNKPNTKILLYPCNIVGFIRLIWLLATVGYVAISRAYGIEPPFWVRFWLGIGLLFDVLILDIVDGYLARRFNHTTKFGAVFELVLDLLGHTGVWYLSGLAIAPLFVASEWLTGAFIAIFVFVPNDSWKKLLHENGPWFVRIYFIRPKGVRVINNYSNAAHFIFPAAYFVFQEWNGLHNITILGLIMFEVVSLYMIYTFVMQLLILENPDNTLAQT